MLTGACLLCLSSLGTAARAEPETKVSGYVHVDWVAMRQSSQDEVTQSGVPLNENRFLLRRARMRLERDQGVFHGVFEIDANTVSDFQLRPLDAEVSFKWPAEQHYARTPWATDPTGGKQVAPRGPWFMVTTGLFRTPFGYEVPESERDRPILERSTVSNALFPQSFDLGLRVVGGFQALRWALGIMNGDPIGERTFPGRDPNESKDMVFRVGGASEVVTGVRLEAGFSGLTGRGFHRGVAATKDTIQWSDINNNGLIDSVAELTAIPGRPAEASQSFKRFAIGADLRATATMPVLGDLHLRAEIMRSSNLDRGLYLSDPVVTTYDTRQLGWYVGAAQELTRWAMIAVRYDRYDPDADAREREPFGVVPRDLSMSTWSFAAAGRYGQARLIAQYDHRSNALGRDVSGRPTTLADDSFTIRAEVRF